MGGWIRWKYSQLSPAKAEARAELGNIQGVSKITGISGNRA